VQKALKQNAPDTLEVLADSRVAVENITRLASSQGYQVTEIPEGINFKLTLKKSSL
jgi:TusA-related sulfurtransferase